jgi:hypothetical protein
VEKVLADIDADHGDRDIEFLRHGVLLVFGAPYQLRLLAGPAALPDRNGSLRRRASSEPQAHAKSVHESRRYVMFC